MENAAKAAKEHLNNVFFFKGDEELKYEVTSAFPEFINNDLSHIRSRTVKDFSLVT